MHKEAKEYLDNLVLKMFETKDFKEARKLFYISQHYEGFTELYTDKRYIMDTLIKKNVEPKVARKFVDDYFSRYLQVYVDTKW